MTTMFKKRLNAASVEKKAIIRLLEVPIHLVRMT